MFGKLLKRHFSPLNSKKSTNKVFKICITGGPCSGKTTITSWLKQRFNPQYNVMTIPELATMTAGSGVNIIPDYFETEEDHKDFTVSIIPQKSSIRTIPKAGKNSKKLTQIGKHDEIPNEHGAVLL